MPADLCYIVFGVGEAAGCGLSGTANLGDYGADDSWRSEEPPALSSQRSKSRSPTPTCTFPHTVSIPHFVVLN